MKSSFTDNQQSQISHWLHKADFDTKIAQGLTAYLPLNEAFLSIASRRHIINSAQYSIDLQYYIWKNDTIGQFLLADLLHAANRGVKIRLLIDDQNGTQLDSTLKQLILHPHFEIKLFNPYQFRKFRLLDYIFRFKKINHRMHNKLIIGDQNIAVTGGRNISREYFDASENFQFTDLDILFFGTAIQQANQIFDLFWNDELSVDVSKLISKGSHVGLQQLQNHYELSGLRQSVQQKQIKEAEHYIHHALETAAAQWVTAHFIGDSPKKIRVQARGQELISEQIIALMGSPKQNIELVSAYFVPTQKGLNYFQELTQKNVTVRVLTNSYLANDVPIVHAFYQKYRKDLLATGVKLYEFKPYIQRKKRTWYEIMTGNVIPSKSKNASRLHAKFFDIDGKVFIGSFNFDPRSVHLNTEVGLILESNELQNEVSTSLDCHLSTIAYEVKLNELNQLEWRESLENGTVISHTIEPNTTKFQRLSIKIVSFLPIEWMM
ncbi:phospholipase [Acinetobacter sp. ANC 4558]|uniref:phospholipase D family protein n=1 Tax=Acinetobacter sp. ANC 4558 TaxID=1977876 RepID=UPI000A3567C3|nr:phospholipase D family protein [Acinetobacter sp. ANC 4558]OTG87010.1 phospholipase [Acinetobacter sp. ANC 4558]